MPTKIEGGVGSKGSENYGQSPGEKFWWHWVSHTNEPWAHLWCSKYGHDRPPSQLIRFNEEQQGSPIWTKAKGGRHLVQQHNFWEIRDGRNVRFWEDSSNQLPRLGGNPRWNPIQELARVEGRSLIHHFWQEKITNEWRCWIFIKKADQIEVEDWDTFQEEMHRRSIKPIEG